MKLRITKIGPGDIYLWPSIEIRWSKKHGLWCLFIWWFTRCVCIAPAQKEQPHEILN